LGPNISAYAIGHQYQNILPIMPIRKQNQEFLLRYFCFANQVVHVSIVHVCDANIVFIAHLKKNRASGCCFVELIFEDAGNFPLQSSWNPFHGYGKV
jgi:hypothetical protein